MKNVENVEMNFIPMMNLENIRRNVNEIFSGLCFYTNFVMNTRFRHGIMTPKESPFPIS